MAVYTATSTARFQSSPSIQRETDEILQLFVDDFISILSLYTEGDCKVAQYTTFKLSYICAALLNILSAQIIFNRFAIFYK